MPSKNKDYDKKIFRLIYVLNKLNSNAPLKTAELAEEFSVTRRTVQRDLELLSTAGFPLTYDDNGHKFMDGFSLQKIIVSPQERFLLNTFYSLFSKAGAPFDSAAKDFFNKILFASKDTGSVSNDGFTIRQQKIIKDEIKELSKFLPARLEDLSYPPNFIKKINEFLMEIESKLNKLKKQDKVDIGFARYKPCDRGKPLAVISVPKTYFHDPYIKFDFCNLEKNRNFEIRAHLPYSRHQVFMVELRTEMSFKFWGAHLKSKQLTCFDDFASYLGFSNKRKEFNYQSSYGNDKGVLITSSSIHWEEEIPMPKEDIKPFLNKTGGFVVISPSSRKNKTKNK